MKKPHPVVVAGLVVVGMFPAESHAAVVIAVADAELTESTPNPTAEVPNPVAASGGNGINSFMNYRWTGNGVAPGPTTANRNDVIAMRFDLSAYTLADIENVTLSLTSFRGTPPATQALNPLRLYGVAVDATATTGSNTASTWDDATISFNSMPGLTFDANSSTQGLNIPQLTDLGTLPTGTLTRGQIVDFTNPAITSFINSYAGTSVTFLIAGDAEVTGQTRFATREATELEGSTPTGPAGSFGPTLTFTVVPEPSSALLGALGLLGLALRRRR